MSKALDTYKPEHNPFRVSNQLSDNEEYIIDWTKRPIQRDSYVQEEFYSGKKKLYRACCTTKKIKIFNYLILN
ncbi:MAG: hypothetical protein LC115_02220, partial [Bacteroidia bacterium]|nr:hypothetical protein [Bacteroidia bacterium]